MCNLYRNALFFISLVLVTQSKTHEVDLNRCPGNKWRCDCGHCIDKNWTCDGLIGCRDGSDESHKTCGSSVCPKHKWRCNYGGCIDKSEVCDGMIKCKDGSDESIETCANNICHKEKWRCDYGGCINKQRVCDGVMHCRDESDETAKVCGNLSLHRGDIPCQTKSPKYTATCKIPSYSVCDGISNCRYNADECFCEGSRQIEKYHQSHYHSTCFRCMNNLFIIPQYKVCDGNFDCDDLSDECICGNVKADCDILHLKDSEINSKKAANYKSEFENFYDDLKMDRFLCCNNFRGCKNLETYNCSEMYSCLGFPEVGHVKKSFADDDIPTCFFEDDEWSFLQKSIKLTLSPRCDGVDDGYEEELNCNHRFTCSKNSSILEPLNIGLHKVCDKIPDCPDQTDELQCNDSNHFYCQAGNMKYITTDKLCDGRSDSDDNMDECQNCVTSPLSDDKRLIAHPGINLLLVVSASLSFFGNVIRIYVEVVNWKTKRSTMTNAAKVNSLVIISLAAADFVVSMYLGILLAVNWHFYTKGWYCIFDKLWRTGSLCKCLGVIVSLGSQSSAMSLLLLTVQRYRGITRPRVHQSLKTTSFAIFFIWTVSALMAALPLIGSEDYFVGHVEYTSNPLMGKISKYNNTKIIHNLELIIVGNNTKRFGNETISWKFIFDKMKTIHPDLKPLHMYHYYSTHGTCLPNFYPVPGKDISIAYSYSIVMFNATCFLAIVYLYGLIWRTIRSTSRKVNNKELDRGFHLRISFIIGTDFMCWMPIAVMSTMSVCGVTIPPSVYAATASFILPINSVINPLIYSNLPSTIHQYTCHGIEWIKGKLHGQDA